MRNYFTRSFRSWWPWLAILLTSPAQATQADIPGPPGSVAFGARVALLPNGNIVVTDPRYADRGAAYLFSPSGQMISKLTGSAAGTGGNSRSDWDQIEISVLANGNYVLSYRYWGTAAANNLGAVTWGSAKTGVSGVINASNSLVGSHADDQVGKGGTIALTNGNYVTQSGNWSPDGVNRLGALTWGNGSTGTVGVVSAANSSTDNGGMTYGGFHSIVPLPNGNYVMVNASANGDRGYARWGSGNAPTVGEPTELNSLVGQTPGDRVGEVTALVNGNYVVSTYYWSYGNLTNAGAATWCNGTTGCTGKISTQNSLVGNHSYNYVGFPGVTALANGNYVVSSSDWEDSAHLDQGAVTWGNGFTGTTGEVGPSNSIVGTSDGDTVGQNGPAPSPGAVSPLKSGDYVVSAVFWDNGTKEDVGAVRWVDGSHAASGFLTPANSLIGTVAGERVGTNGIVELANGNYVITDSYWPTGGDYNWIGAVTWADGTRETSGIISAANSITGGQIGDLPNEVSPLPNGDFLIGSSFWDKGATQDVGAVSYADGSHSTNGVVLQFNSVIGSTQGDWIHEQAALSDGSYFVGSQAWSNGTTRSAGALSWLSGKGIVSASVTAANSLVGTAYLDNLGSGGAIPLPEAMFMLISPVWDNGLAWNVGAVTLLKAGPVTGLINAGNSVLGTAEGGGNEYNLPGMYVDYDAAHQRAVVGRPPSNLVSLFTVDADLIFTSGFEDQFVLCNSYDTGSCGRR